MIRQDAVHWIWRAYREGWAIGMFNAHHLEAMQAIAAAADRLKAPIMLSTTMGGLRHVGLEYFMGMAAAARRSVTVPLILHLDHGADFATVKACIAAGFDSVMIDASASSYEANVEAVRRVVELARRHGVGVEAQIGETLAEEGPEIAGRKTTVEEAKRFVDETGIDYLAVSIGNTPGQLSSNAEIDVPLAKSLSAALDVPLVLHGGSSVPEEVVRSLTGAGIAKVNIDAAVKGAFRQTLREYYAVPEPVIDTREPLGVARQRATAAVEERIRWFGAAGRFA